MAAVVAFVFVFVMIWLIRYDYIDAWRYQKGRLPGYVLNFEAVYRVGADGEASPTDYYYIFTSVEGLNNETNAVIKQKGRTPDVRIAPGPEYHHYEKYDYLVSESVKKEDISDMITPEMKETWKAVRNAR